MMRHVRAIVSNQAHLTGDTRAYIMSKFGLETVADQLRRTHERECQAADTHSDWMWSRSWSQHVTDRLGQFTEDAVPGEEAAIWECPVCEASFVSSAALKTHARRAHDIHEQHRPVFKQGTTFHGWVYQYAVDVERSSPSGSP